MSWNATTQAVVEILAVACCSNFHLESIGCKLEQEDKCTPQLTSSNVISMPHKLPPGETHGSTTDQVSGTILIECNQAAKRMNHEIVLTVPPSQPDWFYTVVPLPLPLAGMSSVSDHMKFFRSTKLNTNIDPLRGPASGPSCHHTCEIHDLLLRTRWTGSRLAWSTGSRPDVAQR